PDGIQLKFPVLAEVDGMPALSAYDPINIRQYYMRAHDVDGSGWNEPVLLGNSMGPGSQAALLVVDGRPAVSFKQQQKHALMYVRALDSEGNSWPEATAVGVHGGATSMTVVDGKPLISI